MSLNGKINKSQALSGTLVKSLGSGGDPNPVVTHGTGQNSILSVNPSDPNVASGINSIAIGTANESTARGTVTIGVLNKATAQSAIAIGDKVENEPNNQATNLGSIAIGSSNTSSGLYAVAIGRANVASEHSAVTLGYGNTASGRGALAANALNVASAKFATSMGAYSKATGGASLVAGKYNIEDTGAITDQNTDARKYALIIGNGTADDARSNAATIDWDGNAVVAGKLTVGAAPVNAMDVATKQYVDSQGGGGGTSDYTDLTNKPQINGNTLTGNKTAASLGLIAAPSSPATGAFLVYNGTAWVAQTLAAWQGGSY